jgi:hypothetical protein
MLHALAHALAAGDTAHEKVDSAEGKMAQEARLR